MRADLAQEVHGIAGLADDLEARVLEQPGDPLAKEGLVLADDDAHGVNLCGPTPGGKKVDQARRGEVGLRQEAARAARVDRAPEGGASTVETSTTDGPS